MNDADHIGEVQPRQAELDLDLTDLAPLEDFELPEKACDLGRPEGCESCQ